MNLLFEEQIYNIETLTNDQREYLKQKCTEFRHNIDNIRTSGDFDTILKNYGNDEYNLDIENEHNVDHEKTTRIRNLYPEFEVIGFIYGKPILSIKPFSKNRMTRDEYMFKASLYYNLIDKCMSLYHFLETYELYSELSENIDLLMCYNILSYHMPDKHIFCFLSVLKSSYFSTNEKAKEFLEYCIIKYNEIMNTGQITILHSIKRQSGSEYILKCMGKNVELTTSMKIKIKIDEPVLFDVGGTGGVDGDY